MTQSARILFVDDDPRILAGYQRTLRASYSIHCADNPVDALALIERDEPFDVIVSDLAMPKMMGIEFLERACQQAPNTTRIMLTGNGDLHSAMNALEQGQIFRFLLKPVSTETLRAALDAAAEQYRLVTAEQELLAKTLRGAVHVLTEILSTVAPEIFGRAQALRLNMRKLGRALQAESQWTIELAALLSDIGMVTLPPEAVHKIRYEQELSDAERGVLKRLPEISSNLIAHIPRLELVAKIILYQNKMYDGTGFPQDEVAGTDIPFGSRMLRLLKDLAQLEAMGKTRTAAFAHLERDGAKYDPRILEAAISVFCESNFVREGDVAPCRVKLDQLLPGDVLHEDIVANDGTRLLRAGQVLTGTYLERIRNFRAIVGVKEPVCITARANACANNPA